MKRIKRPLLPLAIAFAAAGLVAGCGSDSGTPTGIVSFDVTDAPVDDVARVQLTLSGIALKPAGGPARFYAYPAPLVIDNLLDLQGGNAVGVLGDTRVPAGRYQWVRLYVIAGGDDSYVIDDTGGTWDLLIPGQQGNNPKARYVQLVSGFTVPAGGRADFTIDVDLRRALTKPAGADHYFLRPALRIVDNSDDGVIAGTVDDLLVQGAGCTADPVTGEGNAVYLYTGNDAAAGDVWLDDNGLPLSADNPVSVAPVIQDDNGNWNFRFDYVAAGTYTVAFTCQASGDDPATDDSIVFDADASVTVNPDATATVDLAAPAP
ncbi:MAG: DUF4382 domain-containing protein [Pseudomonadota bacterium]